MRRRGRGVEIRRIGATEPCEGTAGEQQRAHVPSSSSQLLLPGSSYLSPSPGRGPPRCHRGAPAGRASPELPPLPEPGAVGAVGAVGAGLFPAEGCAGCPERQAEHGPHQPGAGRGAGPGAGPARLLPLLREPRPPPNPPCPQQEEEEDGPPQPPCTAQPKGWRCLLAWLPAPSRCPCSSCMVCPSVCPPCRSGVGVGQNSPPFLSTIPRAQRGGPGSPHPTLSTSGDAPTSCGSSPLGSCVYLCACVGRNTWDFLGFPGVPNSTSFPAFRPPQEVVPCALGLELSRILPGEAYIFWWFLCDFFLTSKQLNHSFEC